MHVDAAHIGSTLAKMRRDVASHTGQTPERFVEQQMVAGGTEVILGMHRDPLGTAILLDTGGVTAELFQDTTLHMLPLDRGWLREEAMLMIKSLKTWPLLNGYRGRPRADVDALAAAVVAFSEMVVDLGAALVEAEINPVFVLEEGRGIVPVDGVAVLAAI